MKVEVVPKEGKKDIRTILLDGEPWKDIHIAVYGRRPSFPSKNSVEEWEEAFNKIEYKQGKNYVLRRLTAQSYHSNQLAKLMKERLIQPHIIEKLIKEFTELGYLDDRAWLEGFIKGHLKRSGRRAILAKLYQKGIHSEEAQVILDEYHDPEEEIQAIKKLVETRYKSKNLKDYRNRQKVIAALMRKGYAFDVINKVVGQQEHLQWH